MGCDFLCVGHCCHDVKDDAFILGGTSSYSAILAETWGLTTAIITSVGKDFLFSSTFEKHNIPLSIKPASQTTIFDNSYQNGDRTQYLRARAATIDQNDIPNAYEGVPIVHFGPIADELHPNVFLKFKNSLKGLSIQGMLRTWDKDGLVKPKVLDWTILKEVDIVFLSDEDIRGNEVYLEHILHNCSHVVKTHGAKGATVYTNGMEVFFPSFPAKELDPTGAGDTFTTAYLMEYEATKNVQSACTFAHCAASFIIESPGLSIVPSIEQIRTRCTAYNGGFASFL